MLSWMFVGVYVLSVLLFSKTNSSGAQFMVQLFREWFPHLSRKEIQDLVFWVRKVGHVAAYAVLTGLTVYACTKTRLSKKHPVLWGGAISLVVAFLDEYQQMRLEHRSGSLNDVLIDFIGICLTAVVIGVVSLWRRRSPRRRDEHVENES